MLFLQHAWRSAIEAIYAITPISRLSERCAIKFETKLRVNQALKVIAHRPKQYLVGFLTNSARHELPTKVGGCSAVFRTTAQKPQNRVE